VNLVVSVNLLVDLEEKSYAEKFKTKKCYTFFRKGYCVDSERSVIG